MTKIGKRRHKSTAQRPDFNRLCRIKRERDDRSLRRIIPSDQARLAHGGEHEREQHSAERYVLGALPRGMRMCAAGGSSARSSSVHFFCVSRKQTRSAITKPEIVVTRAVVAADSAFAITTRSTWRRSCRARLIGRTSIP